MIGERHIKGTHIINVVNFVKSKRGMLGLNTFFNKINKNLAKPDRLEADSFIEKDWYEYELYLEFLTTADHICGSGDLSRVFEMGYQTLKNLGHLSYLTRSPTVHDFLKVGAENWSKFYDFGKPEVVEEKEGKIVVRYHGFPDSKAKCEYFRGSITGMIELCGLDGKVEETACNTEGSDYCEFTITW